MRVIGQPCYVLLNRPYSESSWIVDVYSRTFGRQALLAKGARRLKSKQRGMLLPFQPVLLAWTGKGEVPTLTNAELDFERFTGWDHELSGRAKICGFYCNELLAALMQRGDPSPKLFDAYHQTIVRLLHHSPSRVSAGAVTPPAEHTSSDESPELASDLFKILRNFELRLIAESGYSVSLTHEANSRNAIDPNQYYEFVPKRGFVRADVVSKQSPTSRSSHYFQGRAITALEQGQTEAVHAVTRSQSKQIMRLMLSDLLGHKRILSRDLFFPVMHANQ